MRSIRFAVFTLLITLTVAVAGTAVAQPYDVNVTAGLTVKGAPLALRGYDAVSYFENGGPQLGKAEHALAFGGATYQFVSSESLEQFMKNPSHFLPQYGGFCAYGTALGAKFDGDPLLWKVVDGKLYLNLNPDIQATWSKDVDGNIAKADANWPKIRGASPSKLKPQK